MALTIVLVMLFALAKDDGATVCCSLLPLSFNLLDGCHLNSLEAAAGIMSSSAELTTTARQAIERVMAQHMVLGSSLPPISGKYVDTARSGAWDRTLREAGHSQPSGSAQRMTNPDAAKFGSEFPAVAGTHTLSLCRTPGLTDDTAAAAHPSLLDTGIQILSTLFFNVVLQRGSATAGPSQKGNCVHKAAILSSSVLAMLIILPVNAWSVPSH